MVGEDNHLKQTQDAQADDTGWYLLAEGDWLAGQRFDIPGSAILGRDGSCDITIPGTHLSRRHAELIIKGNVLQIKDLGSSNGTFVNDQRVTEAEVKPGDTVQFDVLTFRIVGPTQPLNIDDRATKVRLVPVPPEQPPPSHTAPVEKKWKTKPTSVGNRYQTMHVSIGKKTAHWLWTTLVIVAIGVTVVAIGYMLTQL